MRLFAVFDERVIGFYDPAGHVAELPAKNTAAERSQAIDKKYTFKVIVFVLDDPGERSRNLDFLLLEVAIEIPDCHTLRPRYVVADVRYGEAPLFVFDFFLALPHDFRIDEDQRTFGQHLALLCSGFCHWFQIDDEQSFAPSDLRSGQAYTRSASHRLEHIVDQTLKVFCILLYVFGSLSQNRVSVHVNGEDHRSSGASLIEKKPDRIIDKPSEAEFVPVWYSGFSTARMLVQIFL